MECHVNQVRYLPEFLAVKYKFSDPELDQKITEKFNNGYWIANILSNDDNILIIYAKEKQGQNLTEDSEFNNAFDTINKIN